MRNQGRCQEFIGSDFAAPLMGGAVGIGKSFASFDDQRATDGLVFQASIAAASAQADQLFFDDPRRFAVFNRARVVLHLFRGGHGEPAPGSERQLGSLARRAAFRTCNSRASRSRACDDQAESGDGKLKTDDRPLQRFSFEATTGPSKSNPARWRHRLQDTARRAKRSERGSQDSNLESPVLETGALASWATAPRESILCGRRDLNPQALSSTGT